MAMLDNYIMAEASNYDAGGPSFGSIEVDTAASPSSRTWVHALTSYEFFRPCSRCHKPINFFDIDAAQPVCSVCSPFAGQDRLLQIRRSSYSDVVKVADIARLSNISGVQTYVINSSKVVFLKRRPQPRPAKGAAGESQCLKCDRHLQDLNTNFCSLQCKLDIEEHGGPYNYALPALSDSHSSEAPPGTPPRAAEQRPHSRSLHDISEGDSLGSQYKRRKGNPHRSPLE